MLNNENTENENPWTKEDDELLEDAEKRVKRLADGFRELREEIEREADEIEREADETEREAAETKRKAAETEKKINEYVEQFNEVQAEIDQSRAEIDQSMAKIDQSRAEIDQMKEDIAAKLASVAKKPKEEKKQVESVDQPVQNAENSTQSQQDHKAYADLEVYNNHRQYVFRKNCLLGSYTAIGLTYFSAGIYLSTEFAKNLSTASAVGATVGYWACSTVLAGAGYLGYKVHEQISKKQFVVDYDVTEYKIYGSTDKGMARV